MIKRCQKILLLSIIAVTLITGCTTTSPERCFMPYAQQHIVDEQGKPTPQLLDLLTTCNIEHDGTLEGIVKVTQAAWLRKPGTERWHLEELSPEQSALLMPLFKNIGCIDEVAPAKQMYDYGILLGATVTRVRSRLAYALAQWEKGVHFKTLVFLGSERPLDPQVESESLLLDLHQNNYPYADATWKFSGTLPTTEHEMIKLVFDQTAFPAGFENVNFVFVNTPMQPAANGTVRRANTMDTINHWMKMNPPVGSCIVFSNQPFVGYQDAAVRSAMPKEFKLQTVGEEASEDASAAVCLDNIARWLYQELQNKKRS